MSIESWSNIADINFIIDTKKRVPDITSRYNIEDPEPNEPTDISLGFSERTHLIKQY
jgi:hypothetical protein